MTQHMMCAMQQGSPATNMLQRVLISALFAGAAAGLIAGLLQLWFVQPVLLHAELYETGTLVHFGTGDVVSAHPELPAFDPVRDGLSLIFTMMTYTGYAILLLCAMSVADDRGAQPRRREPDRPQLAPREQYRQQLYLPRQRRTLPNHGQGQRRLRLLHGTGLARRPGRSVPPGATHPLLRRRGQELFRGQRHRLASAQARIEGLAPRRPRLLDQSA